MYCIHVYIGRAFPTSIDAEDANVPSTPAIDSTQGTMTFYNYSM